MRDIHDEFIASEKRFQYSEHRPESVYKQTLATAVSRLDTMIDGSKSFESEESWLIRRDLVSLSEMIRAAIGMSDANPSDIGIPNDGHPCTGTGFTGSEDHLIPEYKYPATTPTDGAIYKIDADGNETMVGMWDKDANRFYPVP